MNILVINGSPKNNASNSLKLADAFLEGFQENGDQTERIHLYKSRIEPCRGCFSCWTRSPGKCVIPDDMSEKLLDAYLRADTVIWSMPLYSFGMPSQVVAFCNRMLPNALPGMKVLPDGKVRHPHRTDTSGMCHVLVSTCGFYTASQNYEAMLTQFEYMGHTPIAKILCPEGEILGVAEAAPLWGPYLDLARRAGGECRRDGRVAEKTQMGLAQPLMPKEAFLAMAEVHWASVAHA